LFSFQVILDQADLYTNLFSPLVEDFLADRDILDDTKPRPKRIVAIVMEYLRSLEERQIPVQVGGHFVGRHFVKWRLVEPCFIQHDDKMLFWKTPIVIR